MHASAQSSRWSVAALAFYAPVQMQEDHLSKLSQPACGDQCLEVYYECE